MKKTDSIRPSPAAAITAKTNSGSL